MTERQQLSPRSVQSVLITGYYGFGNFGDEVALDILIQSCVQNGLRVSVLCKDSQQIRERHSESDVALISKAALRTRFRAVRTTDFVILGPGGLLKRTPVGGTSSILAVALVDILFCIALGRRFSLHSVGAGDLSLADRAALRLALPYADSITVRDTRSHRALFSAGVSDVSLVDDSIHEHLSLSPSQTARKDLPSNIKAESIAVAPSASDRGAIKDRHSYLTQLYSAIKRTAGTHTKLFGVVSQSGDLADISLLRDLEEMGVEFEKIVDLSEHSLSEALAQMKHIDACVTSRFHVGVIFDYLKKPVVRIGSDPKLSDAPNSPEKTANGREVLFEALSTTGVVPKPRPGFLVVAALATFVHRARVAFNRASWVISGKFDQ